MMRRLLPILLLLGFAFLPLMACVNDMPAMAHEQAIAASCHESAGHSMPAHDDRDRNHRPDACIGCIAPLATTVVRPVSSPAFAVLRHGPALASTALPAQPNAPEPPPPRA